MLRQVACAGFVTVGEFNPNGVALSGNLVSGLTGPNQFEGNVESAFTLGMGGIINFESPGTFETTDGVVTASFAGGNKTLTLTGTYNNDFPAHQFANGLTSFANGGVLEASGTQSMSILNNVEVDLSLSGPGLAPDEYITQIGFVVDRRSASFSGGNFAGFAGVTYSDGSSSGQSTFSYRQNFTSDELFIGFAAPEGLGIETLSLGFDSSANVSTFTFGRIDDFGFVTAVPEPSSALVLSIAAIGLLGRRRRASTPLA